MPLEYKNISTNTFEFTREEDDKVISLQKELEEKKVVIEDLNTRLENAENGLLALYG